jgi:hypothetical protein
MRLRHGGFEREFEKVMLENRKFAPLERLNLGIQKEAHPPIRPGVFL